MKVALIVSLIAILGYVLVDAKPRPNGGTWYGYTLGTVGVLLILWLTMLGIRKRSMTRGRWSLKAWTSAHVYLGLSLIVIGTLATVPYTISLSPSLTSGTMSRQMAGPMGSRLGYNLYTSAVRGTVWGNGSGGTQTVANSVTPGSYGISAVQNHSVYGAIPVRQIVRPGSYSDGIVVTVDY